MNGSDCVRVGERRGKRGKRETYVSRNMRFRKDESAFVERTVNAPAKAHRDKSIKTNLSP